MHVAGLLRVVRCHNVWMREPRGRLHFALKSTDRFFVAHQLLVNHLERDGAVHQLMFRLEHEPHAALAD
jgi:hypothetical protein